ncbi:MAG: hypothetical protein PHG66_05840 [Candidatus Colwellbacteria bacterium]|nr:hypothetical protein [Candidatus Colwellbacteria bacterium]
MLKLILASLDGLSEEVAKLYKQGGDGKFHLQTEEDEGSKQKIAEFRENNIKLQKELDEIKKKFSGVDLESLLAAQRKLTDLGDKKLLEEGKVEELVAQKTERMRLDYEEQIKQLTAALGERDTKLTSTSQRLSEVLIDSEITKAVNAVGVVRKEAMTDIISRGRRTWHLEDNKPTPKEGDRLLYGKDGKAPLTFEEWAQALVIQAPFLFEPSSGGGAGGGAGGSGGAGAGSGKQVDLSKMPLTERLKYGHAQQAKQGGAK